jgi:phosphatidylserine/phosphatidylglycerophosphate/cardiolipin synthase-like enzyme
MRRAIGTMHRCWRPIGSVSRKIWMRAQHWLPAMALALLLVGCSGHPPNTAVSAAAAEQSFGGLDEATPLTAIIKARGVRPLNPRSQVSLLSQAQVELRKTDPEQRYHGITYNLTTTNALDHNWIVQTPDRWNRSSAELPFYPLQCENCVPDVNLPACHRDADCSDGGTCRSLATVAALTERMNQRVCVGHSDAVIDRIYTLVAHARKAVDVTALQPPPDGRFLAALRTAATTLARSGRRVTMRVLIGQYPFEGGTDARALLGELIRDAKAVRGSGLSLYVAAMRSCTGGDDCNSFTWNHAKIVAVDGSAALVGGHNMWSRDYLIDEPVHDLSMQLRGPAATDASRFADALWRFVCGHRGRENAVQLFSYVAGHDSIGTDCMPQLALPAAAAAGSIPILAVGRLGAGITPDFANQGDLARDLILGAARRNIYIAQQDLAFTLGRLDALYPESTLERLTDFLLLDQGDVYIVLSNLGAESRSKMDYSNGTSIETAARKIRQVARGRSSLSDAGLDELLCRRLHMAPIRFGPDATWPGNKPIANHSKFWMVDDRIFHIGSNNFYPVDLQEFGYIVEDRAAAMELRRVYWDPLWHWSKLAAISGEGALRCVFHESAKQ